MGVRELRLVRVCGVCVCSFGQGGAKRERAECAGRCVRVQGGAGVQSDC
jgi:hypothetical protein